ncbi:protein PHOX1-like [Salvia splendens]|uniref:protein PHOX1-like n=1 Tax=Salvia splendens TaxID=180675 RepID=UPI001C25B1EA|nr:protein PHOX1-like [Salvia splendens]XP_042038971.1 protein PHOX1-like [Salvia splendens]XP_042038972.1 protein PHOX1-like [Salvia splendens]XP_042038973.1 protein PHOX1-like [Salvia splendens]XP_042038974.1 protein PHOX1-like [Salvia splendens]
MGKPTTARKKFQIGSKSETAKATERSPKAAAAFDEDTAIFINMSQELKEEGNKLYQRHDHEGAMLKYEKALKLLPPNHIDVASLRTNMAACYMRMGIGEYPRAVNECNLALQVAPKYSKALLRRARCYDAMNRLDLALRDVNSVLSMEPNNTTALEIAENVRRGIEKSGLQIEDKEVVESTTTPTPPPLPAPVHRRVANEKGKRKKNNKFEKKTVVEPQVKNVSEVVEKKTEDKVVVEEKRSVKEEKVVMKSVKLVHGEDIRWAQLPVNCGARLVRDIVVDRFPSLKGVLIKYKDQEGDLVTITTTDELRVAEGLADRQGYLRLYIAEVSPDKEPVYEGTGIEEALGQGHQEPLVVTKNIHAGGRGPTCIEDWIVHFARLFKSHVGFDCDSYMDIHDMGMKLYSEALEDTVTSEDSQELFDIAAAKFQELTALALFNWGNVHLSKARKRMVTAEDSLSESPESSLTQVKDAYDWAQKEYTKAVLKYEEALKVKPDFYEGYLALGLQQFEQAKLSWYYILGSKSDLEIGPSSEILELYNKAEDSMEKGMQIWEEMEEQRLNGLSKYEKDKALFQKFGLGGLFKDISADEASEQATNMRSQIYLLWGTMLYERSVVEYKLSLPSWEECLEVAVEKFELAGASATDIAVMIKNHCSNETALEGFKVDELVQAWNEMYDSDAWRSGVTSTYMEPLFRRRSSFIYGEF